MPSIVVGRQTVHFEAPESGRYHAPILVVPGLFQSFEAWRVLTSMLAHRGWEVYCIARTMPDLDGDPLTEDDCFADVRDKVATVARQLGDRVILFGADLGASVALSLVDELPVLALGLFAPSAPSELGSAFQASLGFRGRRRYGREKGPVAAHDGLSPHAIPREHRLVEPRALIDELTAGLAWNPPTKHPPAIVFSAQDDPLVSAEQTQPFATPEFAKVSPRPLNGRWWPLFGGADVADEVHRFLILTLADRIVEFPDEILED